MAIGGTLSFVSATDAASRELNQNSACEVEFTTSLWR